MLRLTIPVRSLAAVALGGKECRSARTNATKEESSCGGVPAFLQSELGRLRVGHLPLARLGPFSAEPQLSLPAAFSKHVAFSLNTPNNSKATS